MNRVSNLLLRGVRCLPASRAALQLEQGVRLRLLRWAVLRRAGRRSRTVGVLELQPVLVLLLLLHVPLARCCRRAARNHVASLVALLPLNAAALPWGHCGVEHATLLLSCAARG